MFGKMSAVGRSCSTSYLRAPADFSGSLVFQKIPVRQSHVSMVSTSPGLCWWCLLLDEDAVLVKNIHLTCNGGAGRSPSLHFPSAGKCFYNPFKSEMQSGPRLISAGPNQLTAFSTSPRSFQLVCIEDAFIIWTEHF